MMLVMYRMNYSSHILLKVRFDPLPSPISYRRSQHLQNINLTNLNESLVNPNDALQLLRILINKTFIFEVLKPVTLSFHISEGKRIKFIILMSQPQNVINLILPNSVFSLILEVDEID